MQIVGDGASSFLFQEGHNAKKLLQVEDACRTTRVPEQKKKNMRRPADSFPSASSSVQAARECRGSPGEVQDHRAPQASHAGGGISLWHGYRGLGYLASWPGGASSWPARRSAPLLLLPRNSPGIPAESPHGPGRRGCGEGVQLPSRCGGGDRSPGIESDLSGTSLHGSPSLFFGTDPAQFALTTMEWVFLAARLFPL